jgi:putative restriction endonuclease
MQVSLYLQRRRNRRVWHSSQRLSQSGKDCIKYLQRLHFARPGRSTMKFYVGITDWDWYTYLSVQASLDEVNFWRPSGDRQFRALQIGEPFLFKLHSPRNFIVGGGFFTHFTGLPLSFAWTTFGTRNGAQTEDEMRARIERYRRFYAGSFEDYQIGCILLQSPFFFAPDEWIPASDWDQNIVQGRTYDTADLRGQALWGQVQDRLKEKLASALQPQNVAEETDRFGKPQLVMPRLGQGIFRVMVTDAYRRRCAFTGSPVLHVLDAAHIRPFANDGPHELRNGLLLRQDLHTLFDRGYITITPEYRVEVSRRIKKEFENGHEYYAEHGKMIALPDTPALRPADEFLTWHNNNVYVG